MMPLALLGLAAALAGQAGTICNDFLRFFGHFSAHSRSNLALGCALLPVGWVPPVVLLSWLGVRWFGFALDNITATNINQWFSKHRGMAMSCHNMGNRRSTSNLSAVACDFNGFF